MKKILTILFVTILTITLTGCNDKKENKKSSYQELVDQYVRAINEEKPELLYDILPTFMKPVIDSHITKEEIKEIKEYYGSNTKLSIEITGKSKMDDEWLKENNEIIKRDYSAKVEAKECYALEGTLTYKSDEKESTQEIEELWYCDFDGEWLLMFG